MYFRLCVDRSVGGVLRGERVDSRFIRGFLFRDSKKHGRNCVEDALVEGECLMCNFLLSSFSMIVMGLRI